MQRITSCSLQERLNVAQTALKSCCDKSRLKAKAWLKVGTSYLKKFNMGLKNEKPFVT